MLFAVQILDNLVIDLLEVVVDSLRLLSSLFGGLVGLLLGRLGKRGRLGRGRLGSSGLTRGRSSRSGSGSIGLGFRSRSWYKATKVSCQSRLD